MRSEGNNVPESLKEQLLDDYSTADISDEEKVYLEYAEQITVEPAAIDREYIDSLKARGLDDEKLHDIVQVASYFNYINRLADALGVELEGK